MRKRTSLTYRISGCYSGIRQYYRKQTAYRVIGVSILVLTFVFLMGVSSLLFGGGQPQNYIRAQTQHLNILSSGQLHIQEVVSARYNSADQYTGLARQLPKKYVIDRITYRQASLPEPQKFKVHPYKISGDRIHITNDKLLPAGTHEYELSYFVSDKIKSSNGHAEINWNITGNNRVLPIEVIHFSIHPPEAIKAKDIRTTLYIQHVSGSKKEWQAGPGAFSMQHLGNRILISTQRTLKPEETLLAHIGWLPQEGSKISVEEDS